MHPLTSNDLGLFEGFSSGGIGQESRIVHGVCTSVAAVISIVDVTAATSELNQSHAHRTQGPDPHGVSSDRQKPHSHNRKIDDSHRHNSDGHHSHRDDADTDHAHRNNPDGHGAEWCNPDCQSLGLTAAVSWALIR